MNTAFAVTALLLAGLFIAWEVYKAGPKKRPMATMMYPPATYTHVPAPDHAAFLDDIKHSNENTLTVMQPEKPQSPAWSYKDTKPKSTTAMKAPIKRNKPERGIPLTMELIRGEPPKIPKGWKRHDGGECPLSKKTAGLEIMYRTGQKEKIDKNVSTDKYLWKNISSSIESQLDIIAYRIVKPKRKPQAKGKAK